jgi:hypothetical protein
MIFIRLASFPKRRSRIRAAMTFALLEPAREASGGWRLQACGMAKKECR